MQEQPARAGLRLPSAQHQALRYAAQVSFLLSKAIWEKNKIGFSESGRTNQFVQAILLVDSFLTGGEKPKREGRRQFEKCQKGRRGNNLNHLELTKIKIRKNADFMSGQALQNSVKFDLFLLAFNTHLHFGEHQFPLRPSARQVVIAFVNSKLK